MVVALLVGTTLFTACKKENVVVEPVDAATQATGKYTYSELSYNGKTVPASETNLKGTISVSRESASKVGMVLDIRQKSSNEEFMVFDVDDVHVTDQGNGSLSFSYDGEEVAKLKGKKLTINGVDDDNVRFTVSATK